MQGLIQRFTSAFEETKRELEGVVNDLEHSVSLQLATKLNCEDLPQKLQEANLVSRATVQAHVKQVTVTPLPTSEHDHEPTPPPPPPPWARQDLASHAP